MKIIEGDFLNDSITVNKRLFGKYVIEISDEKFALPDDITRLVVLNKTEDRSFWKMLMIILLGITIIGLIIAIPWMIVSKKHSATIGVQTKSGRKFVFVADNAAWKILKNYAGIGAAASW